MVWTNADRLPVDGGLRILLCEQDTTTVMAPYGKWDLAGLLTARRVMSGALSGHPELLLLDLRHLGFIDSSGVHATIELTQRAAAQSTRLEIVPGPRPVQHTFELCGLLERLPFTSPRPSGSSRASFAGQEPSIAAP